MPTLGQSLSSSLAKNWWVLLLRGVVAILFAVLTWAQPANTLAALVLVFGAYALIDGVLGVWMAFRNRDTNPQWRVLLIWGLVSIAAGVMAFAAPVIAGLALLMYIAAWAIVTGLLQIVAAFRLRHEARGARLLGLCGLASVVFGALMVWSPGAGALTVAWLIAAYACIFGVLMVLLAFRLRELKH